MSSYPIADLHSLDERFDPDFEEVAREVDENGAFDQEPEWERAGLDEAASFPGLPPGFEAIRASDIEPEAVEWLWPDRIPVGAVTLLAGDPGLGKSLLTCELAAMLSRGELTDEPAETLMITAEDGLAMTVRPRLEAARAELDLVHLLHLTGTARFSLPDGIAILHGFISMTRPKLVVIDPLSAHLDRAVNSWQDQSIRTALAPLHNLAEEQRVAILLVAHLNKGDSQDPQRRIGGSIGIPAAARSGLLLALDPNDPDHEHGQRRVLAHIKSNLGRLATSLLYRIETTSTEIGQTPRLHLLGESDLQGADLLVQQHRETRSALAEAVDFLQAELETGAKPAKELSTAAAELGISGETLKRAKKKLVVQSVKQGFGGGWLWQLPSSAEPVPGE